MGMKHLLAADGSDILLGEKIQPKLHWWSLGLWPQCELCCGAGGLAERPPPSQHSLLGKVKVMWRVPSQQGDNRHRGCVLPTWPSSWKGSPTRGAQGSSGSQFMRGWSHQEGIGGPRRSFKTEAWNMAFYHMIPQFHFWGTYLIQLKKILNICVFLIKLK